MNDYICIFLVINALMQGFFIGAIIERCRVNRFLEKIINKYKEEEVKGK